MKKITYIALLSCASLFTFSCLDSDSESKDGNKIVEKNVSIPFMVHAGSTHLSCGTLMTELGTENHSGYMKTVRVFVHDVMLMDEDGSTYPITLEKNDWQTENVALLSFANKENCAENSGASLETNMEVVGKIEVPKKATIKGLSFKVGVPEALNHKDQTQAESPLNIIGTFWSWNTGYKFMSVEATVNTDQDFIFHLGSKCNNSVSVATGDEPDCYFSNRPEIMLHHFDTDVSAVQIDLQALMADMDLTSGGTCHSGPGANVCAAGFDALGLDFYDGSNEVVAQANEGQTVFTTAVDHD